MNKTILAMALFLAASLAPAVAPAQERAASLVGFERAEMVQGEVVLSPAGGAVLVKGLVSAYGKPLELYLARGFILSAGGRVGEVPAEAAGGISFDLPAGVPPDADTVVLTLQGSPVAVGVGLLK